MRTECLGKVWSCIYCMARCIYVYWQLRTNDISHLVCTHFSSMSMQGTWGRANRSFFFFIFFPSYCILLPITSDISDGKVLVVMTPWRICSALKTIKIKVQEQFSCCRLVCNAEKLKINKANLGIAQQAHFLWNYWERSPWGQLSRNAS